MRLNVPLLPLIVDVRWRTLGAPRISLRGLMLAVGVMAVFFSLCAYLGRVNRAMAYNNEQAENRPEPGFPIGLSRPFSDRAAEDTNWLRSDWRTSTETPSCVSI